MKKALVCLIFLSVCISPALAIDLDLGLHFGLRTVNDAQIKDVYGNGTVFSPSVSIDFFHGIFAGASYEGGFNRTGEIGLYNEKSTLSVTGWSLFAGYQKSFGKVAPYIAVGFGSFRYKQTVENPDLPEINETQTTVLFQGGIRFHLLKPLYLSGMVQLIPLKVSPIDEEVDLGGLRLLVGIGYRFSF